MGNIYNPYFFCWVFFSCVPSSNDSCDIFTKILKNQSEVAAAVCLAINPKASWSMLFLIGCDDVPVKKDLFSLLGIDPVSR